MNFTMNLKGQINQMRLPKSKALWPLFETIVNSIQSLEETKDCIEPCITVLAIRPVERQMNIDGDEELNHFVEFIVTDNGEGFTERNYKSFLEAYSTYKVQKGCKGIGRFLWLKAFKKIEIHSTYTEEGHWYQREFTFSLENTIDPEDNKKEICAPADGKRETRIHLLGFIPYYRVEVALSLESLVKKVIEHCLPYFIVEGCPQIIVKDNIGESFSLNSYYKDRYKDTLHRDDIIIKGKTFSLYHMIVEEGADKHELHLCANNREVKSYDLAKFISNLNKKISNEERTYYYVGYMAGDYLDRSVNADRYEFNFTDAPVIGSVSEKELTDSAVNYIMAYLNEDLERIQEEKEKRINDFVRDAKPQYRFLLNHCKNVYDKIPVGLTDDKLELELHKLEQEWELEIDKKKLQLEEKNKNNATDSPQFMELFKDYCAGITQLSQASLAEYVIRRKAVIDLLEEALAITDDGKYSKEAQVHSIICPMQVTSDDVRFEEMNLWLIDDRLAYHRFLASDQPMKSLPILETDVSRRMDIAIFNRAISYSADTENINSITIVELKKPQRNDFAADEKNPINQVLGYVGDIKAGKVKKANGRGFGNVKNAAFYCYIIADMTESLAQDAENAGLFRTPDEEGFFGYNVPRGAYIEVISYDKLVKDAKKRNQVLFDKLLSPRADQLIAYRSDT